MQVPLPPPDRFFRPVREADLFRQAQAGCRDSLNRLMAEHDGLVQAVLHKQALGTLPFTEALQAGRIGLWQAIRGYDPQRGWTFSTYAWPCIARRVWAAVQQAGRPTEIPASPLSADHTPDPDPVLAWEATAIPAALTDLVARLPARLRPIVVAHYGLDGDPPLSFRRLGARLGLSGQRIQQLHVQALIWLRHPAHSQALRSLLGRHRLADHQWARTQADTWLRHRRRSRHGR